MLFGEEKQRRLQKQVALVVAVVVVVVVVAVVAVVAAGTWAKALVDAIDGAAVLDITSPDVSCCCCCWCWCCCCWNVGSIGAA